MYIYAGKDPDTQTPPTYTFWGITATALRYSGTRYVSQARRKSLKITGPGCSMHNSLRVREMPAQFFLQSRFHLLGGPSGWLIWIIHTWSFCIVVRFLVSVLLPKDCHGETTDYRHRTLISNPYQPNKESMKTMRTNHAPFSLSIWLFKPFLLPTTKYKDHL